jgi:hypothetical protein
VAYTRTSENPQNANFALTELSEVRELGFLGSSALVYAKMCRLAVAPFQAGAYAVQYVT